MLENLCSILIQKVLNQLVKPQNKKLKSKNQNNKSKKKNQNQKKKNNQNNQNQLKLNQLKNQNQPHKPQKLTLEFKEKKQENQCQDSDKELLKDLNNLKTIMLFLLLFKKLICLLPQNAEKYFFHLILGTRRRFP